MFRVFHINMGPLLIRSKASIGDPEDEFGSKMAISSCCLAAANIEKVMTSTKLTSAYLKGTILMRWPWILL
jgi:hypothetical protein